MMKIPVNFRSLQLKNIFRKDYQYCCIFTTFPHHLSSVVFQQITINSRHSLFSQISRGCTIYYASLPIFGRYISFNYIYIYIYTKRCVRVCVCLCVCNAKQKGKLLHILLRKFHPAIIIHFKRIPVKMPLKCPL